MGGKHTISRRSPETRGNAFAGALALVTGAGQGIGRETALALAARGSRVLVADIDAVAAKQTATDCAGVSYEADVSDRAAVLALAETVHADHGTLDILVNNAGVGMSGAFVDTALEDWDWIVGINFLGVVHFCHAFGPRMLERGKGHVVNVSSALGYLPTPGEPAYGATKAAVLALSRSLRADWARSGVGVSAVCPGVIATGIIDHARFVGDRARPEAVRRVRELFARRGHHPRVVARAILEAIERDRPVVPVGPEAWATWALRGLVPSRLHDNLARLSTTVSERSLR
ncbi:MAG: SDR family NAD(P)-dependent oxidoreductase [Acidimicrobiales bacterium]